MRAYSKSPFDLRKLEHTFIGKQTITHEWKGQTAGGCQNHQMSYKNNPRYSLSLGPRDSQNLVIELRGPKVYQVGLEIIIVSLDDPTLTAPFVSKTSGSYRSGYCVIDLDNLPAGRYHIIPSTFLPGQESPFIMNIKSTTNITVERIN